MKIYTRKGDSGLTFLASGQRQSKTDRRFAALGNLDELSAWLGRLADGLTEKDWPDDHSLLLRTQAACLAAGAWAAEADAQILDQVKDTVKPADIAALESRIDQLSADLPELKSFILPGGTALSSDVHIARAVARRLERSWLRLPDALSEGAAWPLWREYWNRLSDYLFVLARAINQRAGAADVVWRGQS